MTAITNILKSLADWIVMVFDFFFGYLDDVIYIIKITGTFLLKIPDYFAWLPSECLTLVGIIFSIVVVYKILGREG